MIRPRHPGTLTNHVRAVVLIVRLALGTVHARLYLSTDTNSVSWLDSLDLWPNTQNLTDDLVTHADGRDGQIAPASSNCVNIRAANATTFAFDIDIIIFEYLGGELQDCQLFVH